MRTNDATKQRAKDDHTAEEACAGEATQPPDPAMQDKIPKSTSALPHQSSSLTKTKGQASCQPEAPMHLQIL